MDFIQIWHKNYLRRMLCDITSKGFCIGGLFSTTKA